MNMKRFCLLVSLLMILMSSAALAANKPPSKPVDPKASKAAKAPQEAQEPVVTKKFMIHLKNGGSMETTNYTYEGGKIKVALPAGSISLDRSMVLKIEEVTGDDAEPVQKILKLPEEKKGQTPPRTEQRQPQSLDARPSEPTDDNGHTESWWKGQIKQWKTKLADAQDRYAKAQDDWNKYNGLVNTQPAVNPAKPAPTDFQVTQYQDLRGSARVNMDQAQADIDEAKRMLEVELPDQARKAGAPPGWAR